MNLRFARRWVPFEAAALALALAIAWPVPLLHAQPAAASEAQFPIASRIGMTPPAGMTVSRAFQGFEDAKNDIFIRLVAMPDVAYAEIEKAMTNQALKKQNIAVEKREPFAVAGGKGILIIARQDADNVKLRKWLLIAPVGGVTALVSLEIPLAAKNVYSDAAIRASLASLVSRPTIPDDEQLSLVPFHLRDMAGFKVAGIVPGRALQLTDSGKEATDAVEQPQLVIGVAPGGPSSTGDRDSFARLAFAAPPSVRDVRIVSSEPLRIGGQPGHELRALGKDAKTGTEVEMVQWLRFGSGGYIRMVGFAPKESWVAALGRFRTVRDGLEPR